MKHKIIYGSVGLVVAGTAIAVPLGVTLSQEEVQLTDAQRDALAQQKSLQEDMRSIEQNAKDADRVLEETKKAVAEAERQKAEAEQAYNARLAELEAGGNTLAADINAARQQLDDLNNQIAQLEEKLAHETEIQERTAESARQKIEELTRQGSALAQQALDAQTELDRLQTLIDQANQDAESARQAAEQAALTLDQKLADIEQAQQELATLQQSGSSSDEIDNKQQEIAGYRGELPGLQAAADQAQQDAEEQEAKAQGMDEQIEIQEAQISDLEAELAEVEASIDPLRQQKLDSEAEIQRIRGEINTLNQQRAPIQTQYDDNVELLADADAAFNQLVDDIDAASTALNDANIAKRDAENAKLAAQQERDRVQRELDAAKAAAATAPQPTGGSATLSVEQAYKMLSTNRWATNSLAAVENEIDWAHASPAEYWAALEALNLATPSGDLQIWETTAFPYLHNESSAPRAGVASNGLTWGSGDLTNVGQSGETATDVESYNKFVAATSLFIDELSYFTSIDLSRATALEQLRFGRMDSPVSDVKNIDFSHNTNLEKLVFTSDFSMSNLNVSSNKNLDYLYFGNMTPKTTGTTSQPYLQFLDISQNPNLNEYVETGEEKGLRIYGRDFGDTSKSTHKIVGMIKINNSQIKMIMDMYRLSFKSMNSSLRSDAQRITAALQVQNIIWQIGDGSSAKYYKAFGYRPGGLGTNFATTTYDKVPLSETKMWGTALTGAFAKALPWNLAWGLEEVNADGSPKSGGEVLAETGTAIMGNPQSPYNTWNGNNDFTVVTHRA